MRTLIKDELSYSGYLPIYHYVFLTLILLQSLYNFNDQYIAKFLFDYFKVIFHKSVVIILLIHPFTFYWDNSYLYEAG